jgi:hypothetical protein
MGVKMVVGEGRGMAEGDSPGRRAAHSSQVMTSAARSGWGSAARRRAREAGSVSGSRAAANLATSCGSCASIRSARARPC